jgi:BMFP domain-containing protein YqiC
LIKEKIIKLLQQDIVSDLSNEIQEKAGLVSREEYDANCKILSRLEKQVNLLEFEINELKSKS